MKKWALVVNKLDNVILNNYWRKYYTYLELGWDEASIQDYLSNKKNIMQIASFNTTRISFSASSRRNRFYKIFNRLEMLSQDVPFSEAVLKALEKINNEYKIYIISTRSMELQEKTLDVMQNLGFPLSEIEIFFKKSNEKIFSYQRNCLKKIKEEYKSGVGICIDPHFSGLIKQIDFIPIGFTSLKNFNDFNGKLDVICENWYEILDSLNLSR